jgi:hypothetical protein
MWCVFRGKCLMCLGIMCSAHYPRRWYPLRPHLTGLNSFEERNKKENLLKAEHVRFNFWQVSVHCSCNTKLPWKTFDFAPDETTVPVQWGSLSWWTSFRCWVRFDSALNFLTHKLNDIEFQTCYLWIMCSIGWHPHRPHQYHPPPPAYWSIQC